MKLTANYHTHTSRCGHADGTDREYVEAAIQAGFCVLGFADHMPWPDVSAGVQHARMQMQEMEQYFASLYDLRDEYAGEIEIHIGFEAEVFDLLPEQIKLLQDYHCEYLLLGHHYSGYKDGFWAYGRPFEDASLLTAYTDSVVQGIESGCFLYVAHPDLPRFRGDPAVLEEQRRRICIAAKQHQMALEVNVLGLRDNRNYPSEDFFRLAQEYGNTLCIGVDAHSPKQLTDKAALDHAVAFAESFGLPIQTQFALPCL